MAFQIILFVFIFITLLNFLLLFSIFILFSKRRLFLIAYTSKDELEYIISKLKEIQIK
jgi:hypothetical protein